MAGHAGPPPGADREPDDALPPQAAESAEGAATAGSQLGGGGAAQQQPPAAAAAEPAAAAAGEEAHPEGQEYWFSDDDGADADWLDEAEEGDLMEDDEELLLEEEWHGDEEWFGQGGEEEEDLDEEWDVVEDDDMSQSSEEPEAELAAEGRLAEETAGRHVCPGWAAYSVPTASHHFQSADALAVAEVAGPSGGVLAATFDMQGVAVWLLPAAGHMQGLGKAQPGAVRLGGFQAPRDAFSLAFSPCGRYLATGGEGGLLTLYSVDPSAPPRPQLPPGRVRFEGLNYFFTPLLLPQQLRKLQEEQGQQQSPPQQQVQEQVRQQQAQDQQQQQQQEVQEQQQQQQAQDRQLEASPEAQQQLLSLPAGSSSPGAGASNGIVNTAAVSSGSLPPGGSAAGHLTSPGGRFADFMDLAVEATRERLEAQGHRGGAGAARQAAQHAQQGQAAAAAGAGAAHSEDEAEQNRGFLRAVMGQDLLSLGGQPPAQWLEGEEHEELMAQHVAAELNSAMQRAGMAARLLSTAVSAGGEVEQVAAAVGGAALAGDAGPVASDAAQQQRQQRDARKGKQPVEQAGPEQEQQRQQQMEQQQQQRGRHELQGAAPMAAVQLRGILAVGLEPGQARNVPFVSDGMLNGLRFGRVAGKQRLLAADQSGYVYIFEVPALPAAVAGSTSAAGGSNAAGSSVSGDLEAGQLLCSGLGEPSQHWHMRPVNFFCATQHALGAQVSQQRTAKEPRPGKRAGTRAAARAAAAAATRGDGSGEGGAASGGGAFLNAALGPFPTPCNLAAASPDGRWIAVVGDAQAVFLVDQTAGFSWRQLPFDLAGSRERVEQGLEVGAQYCAWNASSTLLALSSDAMHAVFVFEPASGRMVMRVEGHAKPCLSVSFAPWDDRLLVYAEEGKRVHLRHVPEAHGSANSSGGQAAGEAVPGCCEQNSRDDLADAREGVQLLQLPIVQGGVVEGLGLAPMLAPAVNRRRVTGMALSQQGDLLLTTRQGTLLRFLSSQPWGPDRHHAWPPAFRAAVQAVLLCSHRQQALAMRPGEAQTGLWSLPVPLILHIVGLAAGARTSWLRQAAAAEAEAAPASEAAPAAGRAAG